MDAASSPLRDTVFSQWPELASRLGERRMEFAQAAVERAHKYGLKDEGGSTRFLNLCLAFGPSFEMRSEHEWALATLSDPRLGPAVRIHQLVRQAEVVLERAGGPADQLRAGDVALLDRLEELRRVEGVEPPLVSRTPCDLDAVQIAVVGVSACAEYARGDDGWECRSRERLTPPLVADAKTSMPSTVHVLAEAEPDRVTQLQVRQRMHAACGEHHPQLIWIDERGIQRWRGHTAQGVTWPLRPAPPRGLAELALVQENEPLFGILELSNCGIRDEGIPIGPQHLRVGVYSAEQHLFSMRRVGGASVELPLTDTSPPREPEPGKYAIERDGQPLFSQRWDHAIDTDLPRRISDGLGRLFEQWRERTTQSQLRATEHLLTGDATLSWGWRETVLGLAAPPFLEVRVDLDLELSFELELRGELRHGGTTAALCLRAAGKAPLRFAVHRNRPEQDLLALLLPARNRLRWTFSASCDPIASDDGALWGECGPCSGALVVEGGLRPRRAGSGWEFYLHAELEPVTLPFTVCDPVLGQTGQTLALLPALQLLEWSTP